MAKYLEVSQNESIYIVAQSLWRQCFLNDNSLLFKGSLWTLDNLQMLRKSFIGNLDENKGQKFLDKLKGQIGKSEKTLIRLAAELLCLYYLFPSSISAQTKHERVNKVLSWCGDTMPSDHPIVVAFNSGGIGSAGTAYNTRCFYEILWLMEIAIAFKKMFGKKQKTMDEPWQFLAFIDSLAIKGNYQSRHTLLHLFFPDTFERISTLGDKEAIVNVFKKYIPKPHKEIDKNLFEIRKALEAEYNDSNIDFYTESLKSLWKLESLEQKFKDWLRKQKKGNGEGYEESTIYAYANSLKTKNTKKLKNIKIEHINNLFLYSTYDSFHEVYNIIVSHPDYEKVNWESGHYTYGNAMKRYLTFLAEREGKEKESYENIQAPEPNLELSYSLKDIVNDGCFVAETILCQMLNRLQVKKNIILQGPPGTGKTWLAKRLAAALVGSKNSKQVRSMQFHATLSYEDFICGWRPAGDGKLELLDGPFLELVEEAKKNPELPYVMVIEEINRGNPAQIFGEMLTLLEADKRKSDEALRLCYQKHVKEENSDIKTGLLSERDEKIRMIYIPENVYLIGTMNIADRSLAIVDFALRRRFAFFTLEPVFGHLWQNWMHENTKLPKTVFSQIAKKMEACNAMIAEDVSLGKQYAIGHSFVTVGKVIKDLNIWFEEIVKTEIEPLLQEYWFDDPNKIETAINGLLLSSKE